MPLVIAAIVGTALAVITLMLWRRHSVRPQPRTAGVAATSALVVVCMIAGAAAGSIALVVVSVSLLVFPALLLLPSTGSPESDDDEGGGDDGGSPVERPPRGPRAPTEGVEPEWWPEFEREFSAYAERSARRGPDTVPS